MYKIRYMPAKPALDRGAAAMLAALGERLRAARLRRGMTTVVAAELAGITRPTLDRAERGDPAVTMGTYLKVLEVLGLEGAVAGLAAEAGVDGRGEAAAPRRKGSTAPRRIFLRHYDQLRQLVWSRPDRDDPQATVGPTEALQLYERNWRFLDREAMAPRERELIERLAATVGKGVMLV